MTANEFELTEKEINTDIQEGNLFIKGNYLLHLHHLHYLIFPLINNNNNHLRFP